MAKELPKRSEVKIENTWKTEDIYASRDLWEADLAKLSEMGAKIATYEGKLNDSENLYEVMRLNEDIEYTAGRLFGYASRVSDVDTADSENQKLVMRIRSEFVKIGENTAYIEPEILSLPEGTIDSFYEKKQELSRYKRFIGNIVRKKAHMLSPEMEKLLASAGDVTDACSNAFSMFNNADIVFPEITGEDGEKQRLTHGRFVPFLESANREVRKEAFEAMYKTFAGFKNTLAAIYTGNVKSHYFYAKAKKYNSCLEAAVDETNVPKEVYTNLIDAIHSNMDKMYRYVRLRKKLLGVDELHMYDIYTPLVKEADVHIPFEEAKKTVLEALAPLGKDYTDVIEEGFNNRWIDVYENEGKRSGAYSAGIPGCHPFVLLNYSGTLDSMFTLAHEMGHA
ncbi:MAG: oligoendopeptidase F family protein, partial [Lachnospiraceae bacterium]|nr:oligoendopeptidase F family protein [Lachnospiraceae bacterium]